jgi:hypothetical protein
LALNMQSQARMNPTAESRESREREAAWRRGRERRARGETGHFAEDDGAIPDLTSRAFSALAENVRDYAIFLMDPEGVIRFRGEGAHLMKRWAREEELAVLKDELQSRGDSAARGPGQH